MFSACCCVAYTRGVPDPNSIINLRYSKTCSIRKSIIGRKKNRKFGYTFNMLPAFFSAQTYQIVKILFLEHGRMTFMSMLMKNASNEMLINKATVTNNSRSKQQAHGHRWRKFVFDLPHEKAIAGVKRTQRRRRRGVREAKIKFMTETGMWKMLINKSWWCHIATGLQSGKDSDGNFDSTGESRGEFKVSVNAGWVCNQVLEKYFFEITTALSIVSRFFLGENGTSYAKLKILTN